MQKLINKVLNKEVKLPDHDEQLKEEFRNFCQPTKAYNSVEEYNNSQEGKAQQKEAVPVREWISNFIDKWKDDFEKAGYPTYMIPIQYAKQNPEKTEDAEFEVIDTKLLPCSKE